MNLFCKETVEEKIDGIVASRADRWLVMYIVHWLAQPRSGMSLQEPIDVRRVLAAAIEKAKVLIPNLDPVYSANVAYDSALLILAENPGSVDPDQLFASIEEAVKNSRRGDNPRPE